MSSCLMTPQTLELASPFMGWHGIRSKQIYLENTTKLALADVPDVDDVVPRILQQLQPDIDGEVDEDDD